MWHFIQCLFTKTILEIFLFSIYLLNMTEDIFKILFYHVSSIYSWDTSKGGEKQKDQNVKGKVTQLRYAYPKVVC